MFTEKMSNNKLINFDEKIFIAGSKGMVGSSIKKALMKANYGNEKFQGKLLCPTRKELNLLNYQEVEEWFKKNKPTIVIIAAAKVGGIMANSTKPYEFIIENLKIQSNLIELSWINKVKRILFLGSSCIYPKFANQPIKEEYLLSNYLEETNEFYAIAKIAGLKLIESLRKQHNFDGISLMPTNLYGPGDNYHSLNSHVMPSLIRKFDNALNNNLSKVSCWGSGKPLREFLYVEDFADACVYALENWNPEDKEAPKDSNGNNLNFLNVGCKFELSIKELSYKIADITGYKGEIIWDDSKPDGTPRKKLDTSKFTKLGWEAQTDLDEGIRKTLISYKKELSEKNLRE